MSPVRLLTVLAALLILPIGAQAQRKVPESSTATMSTAPSVQRVVIQSKDFEVIQGLQLKLDGLKVASTVVVKLLSGNRSDYGKGISAMVWADLDGDGTLSSDEVLLEDTQFASQAGSDGTLTFSATTTITGTDSFTDTTLVRCCVLYGEEPAADGTFTFGDVVDRSFPVTVSQTSTPPVLSPGKSIPAWAFTVTEHSPGRLGPVIALVSPKGTAISLTKTKVEVLDGDIRVGKARRHGNTVVIPIISRSTTASTIRITPVLKIKKKFSGVVSLLTNLFGQSTTVGIVGKRIVVSRDGIVSLVSVGTGQAVAALTIRESVAGQLRGPLFLVSPKGTAISLTKTKREVIDGDVGVGEPQRTSAPNVMMLPVRRVSTSPSTIRISLVLDISHRAPSSIKIATSLSRLRLLLAKIERAQTGRRKQSRGKSRRNDPPAANPQRQRLKSMKEAIEEFKKDRSELWKAIRKARARGNR